MRRAPRGKRDTATEDRFRSIFEHSIDAILLATPEGQLLAANPEACRMFGRSEAELCAIGRPAIVDPDDPQLHALLRERDRTGAFRGELSFRRKDGSRFPGEISSAFYHDRSGRKLASVTIRDVSERKRSEALIQTTAAAVASSTGTEFFPALVRNLAAVVEARYAFVTECADETSTRVRTLAYWKNGDLAANVEFAAAGTPCEAVLAGEACWHPSGVHRRFTGDAGLVALRAESYVGIPLFGASGRVIGHMVAFDDRPMPNDPRGLPVLRIFAARAAAELARLASERELRRTAQFLQAIIDGAEEGIIVYDRELRYVVFNRFMERMHGRPAAEVLGRRASDVFPWIRESGIDAMVERALRGETVHAPELLLRRPGKSDVWQFARYAPLRDARGEIVAAIALVSDITERRQADETRRATNRFLQEIIDGAAEGIIVYDPELRYVVFNRFMERLHGVRAEEVLGRRAPDVFPFVRESGIDGMVKRVLQGELVHAPDLLLRKPGRPDVWESYRVGPQRDAHGNIVGAIGLVTDITERKRSEEALRQASAEIENLNRQLEAENVYLRRDLIANVSHDLRTPLAALHGYLETLLMKGDSLPADRRRSYLETAARQSEHLGTLIAELFELVKLDFRGFEIHPEPVQLGELAQDVLQKFVLAAEQKGIALRAEIASQLPAVVADIGLIERALDNLIGNALRHTPSGGVVSLAVTPGDGCVQVRVADTGSGIPEAEIPRIFERFYRVDKSRTTGTGGAGLGLAIVKRILDLHGAAVTVKSAPNEGAAFTFALPVTKM